jgi:nicotinamidase-related amidase
MSEASKTALVVIDVQQSFRHQPYWREEEFVPFKVAQQALIDGARRAGMAIIQVLHTDDDRNFRMDSGLVRTMDGFDIPADTVIVKTRHSAFVGTNLEDWLRTRGIERIIVSGIRTEQCCETTTRHGSDIGFDVDYVTEATLTFPMTHASGQVFSAADIKARTELVLAGRFARIATVAEALAG